MNVLTKLCLYIWYQNKDHKGGTGNPDAEGTGYTSICYKSLLNLIINPIIELFDVK